MDFTYQSTARRFLLKAYLSTDHVSVATGKTLAVVISKNGATFGNPNVGATNATEVGSGWYYVDLDTTDTATLGPLVIRATATGVDDVERETQVRKATNLGMTGIPDAVANASGGLPIVGSAPLSYLTGDAYARIGAPAGASLVADLGTATTATQNLVLAVKAKTDNLPADPASTTAVNTRLAEANYTVPPSSGTISAAVWDLATSGHSTSGTFGAAVIAAGSAGDPWSTSLPGAYGAGTAGYLVGTNLDAKVSTRSTYTGGDTAGTTTLLSRLPGTLTLDGSGRVTVGAYASGLDPSTLVWGAVSRTITGGVLTTSPPTASDVASATWSANSRMLTEFAFSVPLTSDALDAIVIENGMNARQALSVIASSAAGVLAGAATSTVTIAAAGVPATNRITATTDADGNRTVVTLSLPT